MSINLREWQYKDTLEEIDDHVRDGLAEEWITHVYEKGESPA